MGIMQIFKKIEALPIGKSKVQNNCIILNGLNGRSGIHQCFEDIDAETFTFQADLNRP